MPSYNFLLSSCNCSAVLLVLLVLNFCYVLTSRLFGALRCAIKLRGDFCAAVVMFYALSKGGTYKQNDILV